MLFRSAEIRADPTSTFSEPFRDRAFVNNNGVDSRFDFGHLVMPPRKRARADPAPKTPTKPRTKNADDTPKPRSKPKPKSPSPLPQSPSADEPSASHLVSFLTGYTDHYDERTASGSDSDSGSSDGHRDDDFEDDEDEEDETPATPLRGLVGTPGRRKAPATTPRRKAGSTTTTPRKPKTPKKVEPEDEGFLRTSMADRYFMLATKGVKTSGMSYSALARPLSQAEYESVANGARGKTEDVQNTLERLAKFFPQWAAELETGFNLLLYGYGSKRRLVNRFATETLNDLGDVVVVNGTFPGLGLKDVLAALELQLPLSEESLAPPGASPLERSAYRVYQTYRSGEDHLYMIIHNIDAPGMKAPRNMAALSLLASCPGIHIVATFDHVNTPLLFGATASNSPKHPPGDGPIPASRGFNWIYHSVPTFDDYDVELSYARLSTAAVGQSKGISEEGALQILHSVPPMAARLLKLILLKQLENGSEGPLHGVAGAAPPFALDVDLVQKAARDKFIAREEERFNALLTEFKDHGLVVTAELDSEGRQGKWAWVPLPRAAVERILEEMKNVEA